MRVRRVVTGHTADGKATVASDTAVDALTLNLLPGAEFYRLWGADQAPTFPDDGSARPVPTYFPPVGGSRFSIFTVGPGSVPTYFPPVISGEVWLELDNGEEVHLRAGDTSCRTGRGTPGATRVPSRAG